MRGWEISGLQTAPPRPRPSGTDAQLGEGKPRWRTNYHTPPPRPGRRGRGVAAFVPGDLLQSLGENCRYNREPGTSSLKDGAEWPQLSDASHHLQLTQKGETEMHKVCRRKAVRDPAPATERVAAQAGGGCQEQSPASQRSRAGVGREGERQALPQRPELPPFQPRTPGKGKGGDFLAGHWIVRLCAFSFPHVSPSPPLPYPHELGVSRIPETGSRGREESGSVLRLVPSPSPGRARMWGAPRLTRSLSTGRAARPREGLGQRRRCAGQPQAGAAKSGIPVTVPRLSRFKLRGGDDRVLPAPAFCPPPHPRPPSPRLFFPGAAPTSSARTVQAASKSSAKLGSIVILLGAPGALGAKGRSAAPWLCPRRRRRLP